MADKLAALVIDDDAEAREIVSLVLEKAGYRVVQAPNGEEGLKLACEQVRPDVILLDIAMPVMNGWQFMSARLAWPDLIEVPVIIISGLRSVQHVVSWIGAVALLLKPWSSAELLRAVETAHANAALPD
jgi:chemotaxis family two-component system sensor histidine kinase/response regulator PixL